MSTGDAGPCVRRGQMHLRRTHLVLWMLAVATGCGTSAFLHLTRTKLTPQVRALLGGGANSTYVLHGEDAFLVDVKFGDFARRLRSEIQAERGRDVRRILLTHSHPDHAGGLHLYPDVTGILVHPNTKARLQSKLTAAAPWREVEREVRLVLGGRPVHALYPGIGHTDGDLIAWLPQERILVTGDVFNTGYEPTVDPAAGGNMRALREALDVLLAIPFETVIPGHGALGTRRDVQATRDYLADLERDVRREISLGKSASEIAKTLGRMRSPYRPIPFLANRERSVQLMYQALTGNPFPPL
jgi:cyclase